MDRVTYVKYNSLRSPEYRITTEIHENEQGKWVIKRPGCSAAKPHLDRIAANRQLLGDGYYEHISILDAVAEDERLRFPFAAGETLAERITFVKENREAFEETVNQMLDRILAVQEKYRCVFTPTDAFVSWFGNRYPEEGVPAVCPANLDSVLSNFIETETGLICLDYEWVFDFPIPVEYIRYRCIRYFYNEKMNSLFDGIPRDTVMGWFGFDPEKLDMYWSMESCFQQQIYGKDWKYLYPDRCKKAEITLRALEEEHEEQMRIIQWNESHIKGLKDETEEQKRIIQWNESRIQDLEKENAEQKRIIAWNEENIRNLGEQIRERDDTIRDLNWKNNEQQNSITELNREIEEQESRCKEWENQYNEILHSSSWRITRPLRGISAMVKRKKQK